MDRPTISSPWRPAPWMEAAFIFAVTLAVYLPALGGGMLWDDDAHVTRLALRSFSGLWSIWTDLHATQQYYPLLHSAFWLEHHIWGDSTLGYHLTNVLLHAASACLVVQLLRILGLNGAFLAGLIFAVHPVCVESVAWISEQKNTLSLLFYLLAALRYLRYDQLRGQPAERRAYASASILFAMALLTKSVTATLPAALLVVFWWENGRIAWKRDVVPLLPWMAAALISGSLTSWVERNIGGAQGTDFDLGLVQRFLLAGRITWFYLRKIVWPTDLVLIYPRWDIGSASAVWAIGLASVVLVTLVLFFIARRRRGLLAAWLLFIGTLFPALGFFNVYPFIFSYVADHFQYHAMIPVIAAASALAVGLVKKAAPAGRAIGWSVVAVAVTLLALASASDSAAFQSQLTVFSATLKENPKSWMAHDSVGIWYKDHGDPLKAIAHFQEALRLRPDYPQAHNNMGLCYEGEGDMNSAISEFRAALRLKKDLVEAHNNLGSALVADPDHLDEAVAEFREAVRLQPDFAGAHDNLGSALLRQPGGMVAAVAEYRRAIAIDPAFADPHAHLGYALSTLPDRAEEAIGEYRAAVHLNPSDAQVRNNLGLALIAQGRPLEAVEELNEALRIAPGFVEIHLNLAIALLSIPGRRNEAAQQLEAYLQVRPANEMTQQILEQIQASGP
jgi:tetratricopeptide (TPR) repeat protein